MFSVKAPRFITHIKRLRDIHKPLGSSFACAELFESFIDPAFVHLPKRYNTALVTAPGEPVAEGVLP
ncbi:hypothetical protein D9M73_259680 [compost metagenome]